MYQCRPMTLRRPVWRSYLADATSISWITSESMFFTSPFRIVVAETCKEPLHASPHKQRRH